MFVLAKSWEGKMLEYKHSELLGYFKNDVVILVKRQLACPQLDYICPDQHRPSASVLLLLRPDRPIPYRSPGIMPELLALRAYREIF